MDRPLSVAALLACASPLWLGIFARWARHDARFRPVVFVALGMVLMALLLLCLPGFALWLAHLL